MQSYSFSSSSYSSSSSSSNTNNGPGRSEKQSHAYSSEQHSGPQGTTVRTTTQDNDEPAVEETRHFNPSGREVPGDGDSRAPGRTLEGSTTGNVQGRVDDVSGLSEADTDRIYRERMEDEYAKREGGA